MSQAGRPVVDWVDEVEFEPGPPHVRMGTHRIDEGDWLRIDDLWPSELAHKAQLLQERRNDVVAVADEGPDSGAAQAETLALLIDWIGRFGSGDAPAPADIGDPQLAGPHSAPAGAGDPQPPGLHSAPDLEQAALLVPDDLCLMAVGDGPPVLTAAVVCFPSYWRLADKIGRPMAAIHQPVPNYAESLGRRPDRLMESLAGDRIVSRRNWMVHEGNELFAPDRTEAPSLVAADVPDRLWLRSERQTLRRLPTSDHVLFTIRVQQRSVGELASRPDIAARLAAAVRAEPPDRHDRLAGGQIEPLLAWLDEIAT